MNLLIETELRFYDSRRTEMIPPPGVHFLSQESIDALERARKRGAEIEARHVKRVVE